jgi:predicted negative regulator of RcsB-dependent stress response
LDIYKTEDEQVQALKKWWSDNGASTVVSIVVALAVVFGWRGWQDQQRAQVDAASYAYDALMVAVSDVASDPSDINIAKAEHLAETLKTDYSDSGFAQFAALFKARQAVQDKDWGVAESELRWVLNNEPGIEMRLLTELRLAKVQFSSGEVEAALNTLDQDASAFAPQFAELRGDILQAEKNYSAAYAAYQSARDMAEAVNMPVPPLVESKLGYVKSFL